MAPQPNDPVPLDQVQSRRRLHDAADLALLQRERRLLELLLHLAGAEVAEVAALARAAAVALGRGQAGERVLAGLDALLVRRQHHARLALGARDAALAPAAGPPAVAVLDQQVRGADLALGLATAAARGGGGGRCGGPRRVLAVVDGHVGLELVRVGAGGRVPARVLAGRVEVVGQVLGVGVPHLPPVGQAGGEAGR